MVHTVGLSATPAPLGTQAWSDDRDSRPAVIFAASHHVETFATRGGPVPDPHLRGLTSSWRKFGDLAGVDAELAPADPPPLASQRPWPPWTDDDFRLTEEDLANRDSTTNAFEAWCAAQKPHARHGVRTARGTGAPCGHGSPQLPRQVWSGRLRPGRGFGHPRLGDARRGPADAGVAAGRLDPRRLRRGHGDDIGVRHLERTPETPPQAQAAQN
ncbi:MULTISPECIES: hypothetical protein [Streptomyces]|uniref:Uncharacterized protein n=1 Tax=Streptomyces ehimensis TaxID=68195 RepID=A0ABV9BRU0_9ACTN